MTTSKRVSVYYNPNFNLRSIDMYTTKNKINSRLLIHLLVNTVDGNTFEHMILKSSLKSNGYKDLNVLSHFNPYLTSADYKIIKKNILEACKKVEAN